MPMEVLRTTTLDQVRDGMLAALIDEHISKIYADCSERPALKKARKISIEISFTPSGESPMETVDIEFKVKPSLPPEGFTRQMKALSRSKGFGFAPDTDNVDFDPQQTHFEDTEKE